MNVFAAIGRVFLTFLAETGRLAVFAGDAVTGFTRPPVYWSLIGKQMMRIGYYSLPVVGLTAFFTGGVLALQIYNGASRYGAESFVPVVVLVGITRDSVISFAADLGIEVSARRLTRDDVYIADEAFFTGTAAEVTPIRELDRIELGKGERGPITEKIQTAFFDIVNGRNPKYAEWLTAI